MYQDKNPSDKKTDNNKFQLQTSQRQAFLQIFNMYSKEGRINKKHLQSILQRVGYKIQNQDFIKICEDIFNEEEQVNFEQFMNGFKVKDSEFDLREIRNAFRLIAGDDDKYIPLKTIIEMFKKSQLQEQQINYLLNLLSRYVDEKKQLFNYELFLSHLKKL